ncbi:hypothetical protein [Candidatus Magnetaquicoccus inordinatus]|uniref:hypothetical protein n=1 Tax=Candidatus Magnetaquicoccus inordinatus TaxID=2496818 RepID=UPI00102D274D|nr:hypothetical protein [Candidatus Magnetaquicoccus inordinatus]
MASPSQSPGSVAKTITWGSVSVFMYVLLFYYDRELLQLSSQGRWYFIFPIIIAFAFSVVHGNFTAEFWRSLGIRSKK